MRTPLIADVKRHSLEDGPGIRSVVFFKGCPLRCDFCHNPEMQRPGAELIFRAERCIACGDCVRACSSRAISLQREGRIERERCHGCARCALACPASALQRIGQSFTVGELVELLLRDQAYYRQSGGGVTFSGGECTLFPDYLVELARALKQHGLHLVVETAGDFEVSWFEQALLPLLDRVYFDVKIADEQAHRAHCHAGNRRILHNLAQLLLSAPERIEVRVPLVPGVTATPENLTALAHRLRQLGVRKATLLPYNPLGRSMAIGLGRQPPALPARFMTDDEVAAAVASFRTALS